MIFKRLTALLILGVLALPLLAGASTPANSDAASRLEKWRSAFDSSDVEKVQENQAYFFFSESELNELFALEGAKAEKPFATDVKISLADDTLHFQANLKKGLRGKIYLEAVPAADKIRLKVVKAKYFGIRVPAAWAEKLLNKELDKYFDFLYNDATYRSASTGIKDDIIFLKLAFQ